MQKKGRTKPDAFDIWADGRAWSEKIEERTARRYANMYTVTGTSSEDAVYHPTPTFLSDGGDDGGGGDGDGSGASSMTDTFVFPGEALQLQLDAAAQDLAFGSGGGDDTVTFLADVRGCVGEDAFGRLSSMLAAGHGAAAAAAASARAPARVEFNAEVWLDTFWSGKIGRKWSRDADGAVRWFASEYSSICCADEELEWLAGRRQDVQHCARRRRGVLQEMVDQRRGPTRGVLPPLASAPPALPAGLASVRGAVSLLRSVGNGDTRKNANAVAESLIRLAAGDEWADGAKSGASDGDGDGDGGGGGDSGGGGGSGSKSAPQPSPSAGFSQPLADATPSTPRPGASMSTSELGTPEQVQHQHGIALNTSAAGADSPASIRAGVAGKGALAQTRPPTVQRDDTQDAGFDAVARTLQMMLQGADSGLEQAFSRVCADPHFDAGTAVAGRMHALADDVATLLRAAMDRMFLELSVSEAEFLRVVYSAVRGVALGMKAKPGLTSPKFDAKAATGPKAEYKILGTSVGREVQAMSQPTEGSPAGIRLAWKDVAEWTRRPRQWWFGCSSTCTPPPRWPS